MGEPPVSPHHVVDIGNGDGMDKEARFVDMTSPFSTCSLRYVVRVAERRSVESAFVVSLDGVCDHACDVHIDLLVRLVLAPGTYLIGLVGATTENGETLADVIRARVSPDDFARKVVHAYDTKDAFAELSAEERRKHAIYFDRCYYAQRVRAYRDD